MSESTSRPRSFNSRLRGRFRLILAGLGLLCVTGVALAQNTFTESFDYGEGSALVGQGGWTQISSTVNPLTVTGGKVALANTGQDAGVALGFSASSGTLYAGFDLNVAAAQSTGDYFFAFDTSASASNYTARFFAKSSGNGYVLGMQMGVTGATPTYSSTVLDYGVTYRIVIRYDFVSGTLNDTGTFYISPVDPNEANDTSAIATTAWAGTTTENTLAAVVLRQGSSSSAATINSFDNLVVSDSFVAAGNFSTTTAPTVSSTSPADSATDVAVTSPIAITFSEAVNTTGTWYAITSTANGAVAATVSGGPTTFTLTPSANLANNDTISVTVVAADITDQATGTTHLSADKTFSFTTVAAAVAPVVTTPPVTQTVIQGATVQFTVTATGTAPLTYQWRKDGNNLSDTGIVSGSTTDTLTLTGVGLDDSGSYDVVVTNTAGSDTSAAAPLTVNPPPASPTITTQPASQTASDGGTVSFTVAATGTAPFTYQWRKNGTALSDGGVVSGATTDTLTLTGIGTADAGGYDVVVANGIDPAATSEVATLTIVTASGQLGYGGGPYKQNFDGLPSSGTFTLSGTGPFALADAPISATSVAGWSFAKYAGTGANALFRVDAGSGNSGSIYSYGSTGASDRALGSLCSGSTVSRFGLTLVNTTGQTITQFTLSYTGEQWRRGSGAANKLTFEYAVGGTDINTGTFMGDTDLNFVAPTTTGTSTALDGNASANQAMVVATVGDISWGPGQTLILRWTDVDDSGSDDGLGIDDLSFDTYVRPTVVSGSPTDHAVGVDKNTTLSVTFNEPVDVTGDWYSIVGSVTGTHMATVSGGPTTFTFTPTVPFGDEDVTATVFASQITDQATGKFHLASDASVTFSTVPVSTVAIHTVQGSGPTSAYASQTVAVQGVVVAAFQGPGQIGGYYVETPDVDQDADPTTSEGIYVYDNTNSVTVGDMVTVVGTVTEFGTSPNTETEISPVLGFTKTSSGNPLPTAVQVSLPFADSSYAERYEGMLVTFPQSLTITDNYDLGHFGELLLSNGRLSTPTNIVAPGAPAQAQEVANLLNQVILDDGLSVTYPDPTPYLNGTDPATATRRTGSTTTGVTGVLDNKFGAYVVEPTAWPTFVDANPRSDPPASGGTLRIAIGNVQNFMNGDGSGGSFPTPRGATTYAEYQRQLTKVAAGIVKIAPDIMGLTEVENDKVTNSSPDSYGATSAISELVDAINAAAPSGTSYAFVNASAVDIVTDQIHCAFIYRKETVEEAGTVAMLDDPAFDNVARNPLAQTFRQKSTGEKLTVCINHFRAKGSAASGSGNTDSGDGQGTNNALRVQEADAVTAWLATHPTGDSDPDVLIIGDLNSYAKEDPIAHIESAGYTNLTEQFEGEGGYSYSFNGEFGHLDHALATAHLDAQVVSAATWHVNSDEPVYYDYNVENKSTAQQAINAGTPYRYADHDPVIIGVALTPDTVAPRIVSQPASVAVNAGATVTFTVTATGAPDPTYQWRKNGTPIAGATSAWLTLENVQTADAGSYDVIVTNSSGSITSQLARLILVAGDQAPIITSQPAKKTVVVGHDVTFAVGATGVPEPTYQWRKDGTAIPDATTATLTIQNVQWSDAGGYSVVVTNRAGSATSRTAALRVVAKSYAGTYFGQIGQIGFFAIVIHDDNTGVFLGFLTDSKTPFVTKDVTVDDDGKFHFSATASTTTPSLPGPTVGPQPASLDSGSKQSRTVVTAFYDFDGTIDPSGQLTGTLSGSTSSTLTATKSADAATSSVAGFYQTASAGSSAVSYTLVSPDGQVLLLTISATGADAGVGTVDVSGQISVTTADNATVTATVTSASGTLTATVTPVGGEPVIYAGVSEAGAAAQRFVNASVRGVAGTGDNVLIAGFVVTGTDSKPMLIRAVGPGLTGMGVTGALAKPRLEVFSGSQIVASNTGWSTAPNADEIAAVAAHAGAFPLAANSDDSALYLTLPPGAYTMIASGADGGTGVVLLETYDLSEASAAQKLVNVSGRTGIAQGDNVGIAGFVISGTVPKRVLIRGVGPSLADHGVGSPLAHPWITVYRGHTVIAQNSGTHTTAETTAIDAAGTLVGAFPLTASGDATLLLSLDPGVYTVVLSDANGGTGIGLVEVYEVP